MRGGEDITYVDPGPAFPSFAGRAATLLGLGPSLNLHHGRWMRGEGRGRVVCGVNDAAFQPGVDYGFAADRGMALGFFEKACWPSPGKWVLPLEGVRETRAGRFVFYRPGSVRDGTLEMPAGECRRRRRLLHYEGTAVTALHFLWACGAREVGLLGFDVGGGYGVDVSRPAGPDEASFGRTREALFRLGETWGVEVVDLAGAGRILNDE